MNDIIIGKCANCGEDISIGEKYFKCGNTCYCTVCANTTTITDMFEQGCDGLEYVDATSSNPASNDIVYAESEVIG